MATDNKRKLYDALSQDYDMGSYEQFCADLSDEGKRRKLYDATSQDYDYGSWDSFSEQLGYGAGELADEQDGGGVNAGAMSAIVGGVAGGIAVGAPPTEERKRAMGRELRQIQAQGEAMFAEGRERMANVSEYYSGNPIGFRTVEGKPVFNPESGTMERTYLTPTGDRTTSKTAADMSTYSFRQAMGAADMSVGAQIRRAEAELAELRKRLDESGSRVHKEWAEDYEKNDAPLAAVLAANTYVPRQSADKENSALRVAIRQREEQLKNLYEERDRQAGKDVGFWRGFGRVVGDGRTWDFGTGDLLDAMTMMNADQYSAPDATEGEKRAGKDMLKAVYDAQQTEQMFGENASGWYKAGVMGGYMPKFALDFALVGGADAAPTAITKAFTAYLGKKLPAVAANKVGAFSIKVLGCLPEDMARGAAMANSIQLAGTTADAIDRKLGQVELKDGLYTFENPMSWARAIYQAESNTTIENFSEMSGKFIDLPLTKLGKKIFTGRVATQVIAAADKAGLSEIRYGATKMLRHIGINGIPGEIGEEYYGQLWRTIVRNDDRLDAEGNNNFLNWNFHKDIWTGIALTVPLMGALPTSVSAAHYMHYRHKVNKADKAGSSIFQPDEWETIRASIDSATNETMASNIEAILANNSMTIDKKKAVMDYAWATMNMRGYNLVDIAANREDNVDPLSQEIDESYIDGYEASSPQEMNDAQNMYEYQRQRLVTELGSLDSEGIDGILSDIDNDPAGALQRTYDPSLREIVLDYANAKILRDGIIQRVNDDIDERIAQSDAMINARVNGASGMIQPAVMGTDDREVYVVGGTLTINEDGTVDRGASDESIIVRDAVTGKLEFVDPKSIVSGGVAIDPEMEKAMAAESIRREAAQAAVDAMNGTLAFNPDDVVEINDDGGLIQATIVGPAVDEESGMPVEGQIAVQLPDGQQTVFAKEQLQAFADAANLERLNRFEQERAAKRAQQQAAEAEAMRTPFALNDEFTILNDNGTPIRGSITGELDEDGTVEIYTEEPINGNRVNRFTPSELEEMLDTYNGEAVETPQQIESVNIEGEIIPENGNIDAENIPTEEEVVEAQASALSRIPVDEQGQPKYDEVDPETAWDAIVEQAQGDEATAAEVVADIVDEHQADFNAAEKALNKTKEGKPEKRKKGDPAPTMEERIAAKNAAKEALAEAQAIRDRAKSALDHWKKIAGTTQRRESERRAAEDAEARRRAQERAEEEVRLKAERKEAERIEREALNGVPDWNIDTPADARARGYRRNGPQKVDRPEIIDNHAIGNSVEVKFGDDVMPTGNIVVVEASQLQPSHRDGQRNPAHFLDEAQPKERKDAVSRFAAAKIAEAMRPEEITSSVTAYTGAPSINSRGEVIQGNNRSEALRIMYERYSQSADKYKQYLIDHAAEFGLPPEAIAAFEQPVLVNMLDVSDEDAITLGQYVAQDTESGGIERIKPKNAVQKMGDKIRNFANLLLRSADDEASFAQLVDANGVDVLKWMNQHGFITNTQYASAFDSKGTLSAEAANDLKGIMYQSIFTGGSIRLEEMFNKMPAKAQRAILATAFRDYDSPFADRMINEIQQSIIAYNALMGYEQFREATNAEATMLAVEAWKKQSAFDDVTGDPYHPSETFSNFALTLAAMYKGQTQRHIQSVFNMMYDIVQGTEQDNLFEVADKTPKPLAEAIRRVLNLEYQPVTKPTTDNGTNGSAVLDINSEDGQDGRPGSDGNADGAEQSQEEAEPSDSGTGTASDSVQGGEVATEEEIEAIIASMKAKAQIVPFVEITEDNWRKNITTPLGVVKMGENQKEKLFAKGREFQYGMLLETLGNPDIILEEADKQDNIFHERPSSYLFIKTFQKEDGSKYVHFESVTVSQEGMEVSISSHIIRENQLRNKMKSDRLLYKATALDESANSSAEQPISQGGSLSSGDKGSDFALVEQAIGEESFESGPADESAERGQTLGGAVAAAEAVVDTDPTEAQKVAGNYRKGHVQVGTFDVTIEQPVGSVRRGTDADGKAWETTMRNTYGYIRGTEGVDGDHIDVFLSTDIDAWNGRRVVIVDQYNPDGSFDEHKVMLGFNDKDEAINAYLANYESGWENGRRLVFSTAALEDFEKWIESSHRKQKPYHKYKIAEKAEVDESTPENPVYEGAALRVGEKADESSVVYEVAKGMLEAAGIEVTEVSDEEAQEMMRYKNTPVAGQPNRANEKPTSGSVLLSISGNSSSNRAASKESDTKLQNKTTSTKNKIAKFKNGDFSINTDNLNTAIKGLGRLLSMDTKGGSRYTVLQSTAGDTVAVRLSDHRANGNNFRRDEADKNLSIVIERKRYDAPESDIEFTEAVIPLSVFEERPAEVIKSIVKGVEDVLADKPFTLDSTIGTVDGTREKSPRFHIRTYHGTGADFDKFDFKHMGSGEGAQAFGWGGYVTEVKGIGKSYASAIGGKGLLPKIEKVQSNINQVEQWLHDHEDYDKYVRRGNKHLKELRREFEAAKKEGNEKDMQFYKELIELQEQSLLPKNHAALIADKHSQIEEYQKELDELMTELAQHRHLYTVRIPDDMGSNYLDWDDKIPDEIKKKVVMETVLEGVSIDFYGDKLTTAEYFARMGEDVAGFQLYRALTQTLGSEQKASELLSRAGITGIKYAANRNNGGRADGKKNFVLFKESDMKISKHIQFLTTSSGEVYGWTINNQVFLNRDAINPETPLHEYTHLWDEMVRKENPELWSRGKELLRETPVWDEVMNDPNYRDIRDDEDAVASEVHSRLTGKEGASILSDMIDEAKKKGAIETAGAVTLVERLKGWLSDMFESLKATFGKWSRRDLDDLTVEDFKGMTLRDLAEGLAPRQGDMTLERKIKEAGLRIVYYDPNKTGDRRRALLEASDDNNVRFHAAMSSGREDFESLRDRAVAERGIVMPGLNEAQVRVVDVPRHNFTGDKPIAQARKWAKENIVGKHALTDSNGAEVPYTISGRMIDKYLSASAINKSENVGVHLSVLTKLPAVIGESIEAEVHSDYNKDKDGIRSPGNGLSENNLIHRFYGAVDIAGEIYRVKTTIIESNTEDKKKPHSFEVSNVELIEETAGQDGREGSDTHHLRYSETSSEKDTSGNVTTIPVANLLKGVEKSYDSGKKLLEASEKADVSAEDTEVLYRGGETSVEGIVSAKDMAKLGASDRQAVAEFIRNMPCAKISVIKNTDDVDSESDLSDEAKAELLSTVEAGDTVGAYCHQNKKIYIFANRSQREAAGFTLQSTLVHENAHYLADKMDDIDESYLNRFAEAVDQMPSMFFRNLREKLLSVGYDKDDLPGEIFALTLQWLFQKPKSIDRLKGFLSVADAKIFEKIITEQYGEEGRYKDTVIDGFKHRTDEEANLNGFSRANVEVSPDLGRDRGGLGRGERDLSSESGFVDETIRDNANEYRNIEAVRGVLSGRSGGDSGADLARKGDGYGAYSDAEVSYMNDPVSKVMGKNRFSKKRQAEFAARERQRMADRVKELVERMHLNNVEIITDASQLEGKRAKAKGFYNKRTGKITIVIPNNVSTIDAEQTLLHEAVAHYGLRQLFGEQFNTFLDNVYQSADESIRRKIVEMAAQNGWDFRTATEEYLAGLAEDTNFREAQSYTGWWSKIKRLFLDMLDKIGFEGFRDKVGVVLTDNELRYILWRSYQNLAEPGRYRSILGEAADVAKQSELKVGNYAEKGIEAEYAAEPTGIAEINQVNNTFNEQLRQQINHTLPAGHIYQLGRPGKILRSTGIPDLPIQMSATRLQSKATEYGHDFDISEIKNLVKELQEPMAVFAYGNKGKMQNIVVGIESNGKQFIAGLSLNPVVNGKALEINSIRNVFPKDNAEWLNWISQGKMLYADKEKIQALIDKQRTILADVDYLNLDDVTKIVDSFENPTLEGEELFRPGDFSPRDRVYARYAYESVVRSGSYQFKEAVQDSMLGLKELYKAISDGAEAPGHKQNFRIEDVPGFENAYLFENRMSSMNAGEQYEYFQRYMQPLLKEIGRIAGANKRKRRELTDYIMAKHGLERNEYMRNEAAANGEDTDRDFAGLMGMTGEADWRSAEATAQQWVDDYESMVDTADLWEAINKATKATLEKVYLSGIISKETYEKILGMYDYYVPLRGWNETTSEQVYGYLTSKDGPLGGSIMKKAGGRESMADDPIATIGMMADDAIRQGNRNLMKQRFLNFILNHPSDAVSVHDIWLEYNDVSGEWVPVFADVENTDTADEVAQKVEDFEERMKSLRRANPDKYKKGREAQHIPYKVVHGNLREHQILIKRGGRTFVATINGNPRAAQAINGLTNPDVDQNGVVGNMLKLGTWVNRQLSAFYTTRNPDFVVGNFFRDMLYSNCMTWVKESPRYALRFHKNFGSVNPVVMRRLLGKWENGKLDMNNRIEALFYQFMINGGETGYTNVRDIEGHKRAVAAELKKQGSTGRRVWTALGMQLDLLNRSAENCARFAAFVTSREFGRSIDRAIYDAKEISVNFNKKGSGGKMVNANGQTALGKTGAYLSGGGRLLYVFWNAGVQGMTNFGRQAKLHPAKFSAGAAALFTLGYVIPMLAHMLGGGDGDDDDKNAYYNLPEYVRRSNICFYAGDRWITIPLPIEYRAMYGMGELAHGVISGNERYSDSELVRQMAAQVSQIMPLDMLEGGGGISPFIPSAAKPFTEAYILNKGWTGLPVYKDTPFNKNDPEWTKAYASADKHLVDFAKWLNETSGGDDFKKGSIDINPARIEYLLNGTFGGLFTFPNKLKKSAETAFGDRDFEWRNMPIANRLIKSGDDRTANRKLQNEYFKYLKEYEATGQLMRKYENADEDGIMGYAERINFLENSPEYVRWEIFDEFKADIDAYREDISAETDKEERARLETEMYAVMRELVNALHDPAAYRNSEQE